MAHRPPPAHALEGRAEVFMVVEPLGKRREVFVEEDHTGATWARIVAHIAEERYPDARQVTLIEDNLSSHKKSNLTRFSGRSGQGQSSKR